MEENPIEEENIHQCIRNNSLSVSKTFSNKIIFLSAAIIELYHTAKDLSKLIKEYHFKGNTLTVRLKLSDSHQKSKSFISSTPLQELSELLPVAKELLKHMNFTSTGIVRITISISRVEKQKAESVSSRKRKLKLPDKRQYSIDFGL